MLTSALASSMGTAMGWSEAVGPRLIPSGAAMPDMDELDEALQENLKLRRELGDQVAKAKHVSGICTGLASRWLRCQPLLQWSPFLVILDSFRRASCQVITCLAVS